MAQQSAFQKSVILHEESSTENRRRHWKHIVGKQARQKQTDRMTLSRLFLSSERDIRPPRALSPETCWYGREVKRQLNVSTSLDRLNGTARQRGGGGDKERLVTSTGTGKGPELYWSLYFLFSFSPHLHLWNTSDAVTVIAPSSGLINQSHRVRCNL